MSLWCFIRSTAASIALQATPNLNFTAAVHRCFPFSQQWATERSLLFICLIQVHTHTMKTEMTWDMTVFMKTRLSGTRIQAKTSKLRKAKRFPVLLSSTSLSEKHMMLFSMKLQMTLISAFLLPNITARLIRSSPEQIILPASFSSSLAPVTIITVSLMLWLSAETSSVFSQVMITSIITKPSLTVSK